MASRWVGVLVLCSCAAHQGEGGPAVTAVGTATAAARTARIGSAGGTLATADGRLELTVPPGALPTEVELSLTPISNEAPLGIGPAVRLEPSGTTFASPAKLTLHYAAVARGTSPELLLGATQDAMGQWLPAGAPVVDTAAKTVTVPIEHFSDWTFAACAALSVDTYLVSEGVDSHLTVSEQCGDPKSQTAALGPVRPTSKSVDWKKEDPMGMPGPGTLTPDGAAATVSAGSSAGAGALVTVSATWSPGASSRVFTDALAIGTVIDFSIDGQRISVLDTSNVMTMGQSSLVNGANMAGSLGLGYAGTGEGGFMSNPAAGITVSATAGSNNYLDTYNEPCTSAAKTLLSRVSVSHANRERQFIVGSFEGELAISRGTRDCNGLATGDVQVLPFSGVFITRWLVY